MNKLILIPLLVLLTATTYAQEPKTIAAVMDLEAKQGISAGSVSVLSDYLRTQLVNTQKFTIVTRENMEQILKEQNFQMSGCTSNECVVQAGQLLGVRKIFTGSIGKLSKTYIIVLRIVDVQTGQVERSESEKCADCEEDALLISAENLARKIANVLPINNIRAVPTKKLISGDSVVAFWHMDEASGSAVYDSTFGGHNGTALGTTIITGLLGKARSFNGTSDYINFGSNSALNPSSFTFSAWVYPTDVANHQPIIFRGTDAGDSNKLNFSMCIVNSQLYCALSEGPQGTIGPMLSANNWHHLAFTYDASTGYGYGYVDGIQYILPIFNPKTGIKSSNSFDFKIGTAYDHTPVLQNYYFHGIIDEVCVYNIACSADEMKNTAKSLMKGKVH